MDKATLLRVREQLNPILEAASKDIGLKMTLGNCTFRSTSATFKLEVAEVGETGEAMTKEAQDFVSYCATLGLKKEHLFKEFKHPLGGTLKIIGYKPRAKKYPILYSYRGQRYKCHPNWIKPLIITQE
jgi:hypothetical protein